MLYCLNLLLYMLNIFKTKKNNNNTEILIKKEGEATNESKHYPVTTKEWFNSVYTYNKNTKKLLPSADINVIKIIKGYFNMFSLKLEKSIKGPRLRLWMRRLRTNRILVAKPEFKHTNDKVIITLYIYNRELVNYTKKIKKIRNILLFKILNNKYLAKYKSNETITENIPNIIKRNFSKKIEKRNISLTKLKEISLSLIKMIKIKNEILFKSLNKSPVYNFENKALLAFIKRIFIVINFYLRYKKIIFMNKSKFNSVYLLPLKRLLEKLYAKKVEFNIVSLKDYHLNSSLLTQIITIKLRNRKNRVVRVVGAALNKVKLPLTRRLQYFTNIPKKTTIQNLIIRDSFNKSYLREFPTINYQNLTDKSKDNDINVNKLTLFKEKGDKLNIILKYLYPNEYTYYKKDKSDKNVFLKKRKLENTVLDTIKNKAISGIRIEASGRLSKRLIASRAIFKMRQKGSIRNINSSYKGISSVLLRGNITSNTDFSKSNHRTRIGAFGLKGWVSSF